MFVGTRPKHELRPRCSHRQLNVYAHIIQKHWKAHHRREEYKQFLNSLADSKVLFCTHEQNLRVYAGLHSDTDKVIEAHSENQLMRIQDYTPEERLQTLEVALQLVQDHEDTKAVEAYMKKKREDNVRFKPKRSKTTVNAAAILVQHRWRIYRWKHVYESAYAFLHENKQMLQRKPPGSTRSVSMRLTDALTRTDDEKLEAVQREILDAREGLRQERQVAEFEEQRRVEKLINVQKLVPKLNPKSFEYAARIIQYLFRMRQRRKHYASGVFTPKFTPKRKPVTRAASSPSRGSQKAERLAAMYVAPPPSAAVLAARASARVVLQRAMLAEDLFAESAVELSDEGGELVVDEGDTLLNLCSRLLLQTSASGSAPDVGRLRAVLASRRSLGGPSHLDFDAFVEVYNTLVLPAMR